MVAQKKTTNNRLQVSRNFVKKLVVLSVIILALILLWILDSTNFGGNLHFYTKWVSCAQRPLEESSLPGGGVRFYQKAPILTIFRGGNNKVYYCTPLEAEQAGLSAVSYQYQYPHLETSN